MDTPKEQGLRENKEKQYIILKKQRDVLFNFHSLISKGQISVFFISSQGILY